MKALSPPALLVPIFVAFPSLTFAHVTSGSTSGCLGCHTAGTGHMSITAAKQTNLGTQLDGAIRGTLDTFEVAPGGTVTIPITVTNGSSQFGMEINELNDGGVKNKATDTLVGYIADATWTLSTASPNPHYIKSTSPITWSTQQTFNFNLTVPASAPVDFYDVQVIVAGLAGSRWAQDERIYISVTPEPAAAMLLPLALLLRRRRS